MKLSNRLLTRAARLGGQVASVVCVTTVAVLAQDAAAPPAFDVASVKTAVRTDMGIGGVFVYPGGRLLVTQCPLLHLMYYAYSIEEFRVVNLPRWGSEDRWEIEAKPPESSALSKWVPPNLKTAPNVEMRRMLQTLLEGRFQLKVHREQRKESIWALVVAKGGPKLKAPETPERRGFVHFPQGGFFMGQNATMDQLVERIGQTVHRPVLNETGIDGHFDFYIGRHEEDGETDRDVLLMRALQADVGLKLETRQANIEVLVVDHVEKPAGN
jgi:uncharacterized protein (TIGR03435 family)